MLELWVYRKTVPVTMSMMLPATEGCLAGLTGRQNPSKRIDENKGVRFLFIVSNTDMNT